MKIRWVLLVSFVVLAILSSNVLAGPIPKGTWKINGNGFQGDLVITTFTGGNLTGTAYGNDIFGFYNTASQKIMFMRKCIATDPTTYQIYTGYLFKTNGTNQYVLAGTFEAFSGSAATSVKNVTGWYATMQ